MLLSTLRSACDRQLLLTALKVSAVVGTLLNLVNQGPLIWQGGSMTCWSIGMNYLVPFCVSSYSGTQVRLGAGSAAQKK
ncbi:MAG: nitrate/nitrite transporter NrtS [Methyloversatilis sp.]|jgi:hypothetical protein|nr:nitrate/nitrite transporter NrtS [Methyloversatilis sp.]MBP6195527.1 nitrate/nitrite transporter NrtS [Methyloversatilis sp.]MBP9118318.1 nitrate/nitrite transporter NrtS [Methyloversatilis sp.]